MIINKFYGLTNHKGKLSFFNKDTGTILNLESEINKIYKLKEDQAVIIKVSLEVEDDEEIEFSLQELRKILSPNKNKFGYVTNALNDRVRIFTTKLDGDYPIMGVGPDNHGYLWNEKGEEKEGNPDMRLRLYKYRTEDTPQEEPTQEEQKTKE